MSKLRLRKCVGILTVLAALFLVCPVVASPDAAISIEDGSADYDATVTVPINITDASGVGTAKIDLHYNKDVVEVDSVTDGDMGGFLMPAYDNPGGVTSIGWMGAAGLEGDHVFAYVTLHAVGSGGDTSPLHLEVVTFADSWGEPIETTRDDGVFTVTPIPTLQYDLSISSTTGGSVSVSHDAVAEVVAAGESRTFESLEDGTEVDLLADPVEGYRFVNWSGEPIDGVTDPSTTINMNDNYSITANFEEVIVTYYTLTVTCNLTEGSVTLDPTQPGEGYVAGTSVKLTAVPEAGYKFDSWGGDLSGSANPDTITMDSPKTVTANFAQIPPTETPVTGNVVEVGYIDVTAPSPIELGDMLRGATTTGHSATPGSVDTNYETWSVEAKDETNDGYMRLADGTPLIKTLQIGKSVGDYAGAAVGILYVDETSLPFYVSQQVELGDAIGSYSITITFTGII